MRTILTKAQQQAWLDSNDTTLVHKWSCHGMGNSKILDSSGNIIGRASGCGYDRFGSALGNAISELFPAEILKLAQRECKGSRQNYKTSQKFYGIFYNSVDKQAWLDGACGEQSMKTILNKIGFTLEYVGENERNQTGETSYKLAPVTKRERDWLSQ